MTRWRLTVEYDGGHSWAGSGRTMGRRFRRALEQALFPNGPGSWSTLHAAGRTDAGVHALAMTAHVDVAKTLTEHRLREGINALVRPNPVSVTEVSKGRR
jgi:tRNA pseudouridine38-40 synthase